MAKVIINADEFGVASSVNRAIVKGFHQGILSSTTVVCGGRAFDEAVRYAKNSESMSVGLHFYLTDFVPTANVTRVPSLVGPNGKMHPVMEFLRRFFTGRIRLNEVHIEMNAQFEQASTWFGPLTHVDGHNNLHILPGIFDRLIETMSRFDIFRLRIPTERLTVCDSSQCTKYLIKCAINGLSHFALQTLPPQFITTADFFGLAHSGHMVSERLEKFLILSSKSLTSEIMVHPAEILSENERLELDQIFGHKQALIGTLVDGYQYHQEYLALMDPKLKACLNNLSLELINYSQL